MCIFFFKQKTAYEMRISDWSSDVCSSDLIIAITLGTVALASFTTQATVVSVIAIIMTVGVYGFVACVVKLDDAGLYLSQRQSVVLTAVGRGILIVAPYLMKGLSIVGTIAMFLVGGGLLAHGLPGLEAWLHNLLPIGRAPWRERVGQYVDI